MSNAFLEKLLSWSIIKYEDGPALKRFSFFLTKCKNAMKTNEHMAVLNHPPNMQSVVQKLPANLQTKWHENADEKTEKLLILETSPKLWSTRPKQQTTQFTVKKRSTAQEQRPNRRFLWRTKRSYHLTIPKVRVLSPA